MSIAAGATRMGRAAAESLMVDTWRCVHSVPGEFDSSTGVWSDPTVDVVFDGPGRLRDTDSQGTRDESQGETTIRGALVLSLPVASSGQLRVDDVLECTSAMFDPALVGVRVRVVDLHQQTHATARRLSVEVESWPTT